MPEINVTAKLWGGDSFEVMIEDADSVETLRAIMMSVRPEIGEDARLAYKGRFLKDTEVLRAIGMSSGDILAIAKWRRLAKPSVGVAETPQASTTASAPVSAPRGSLRHWFETEYRKGSGLTVPEFEVIKEYESYIHTPTGIIVWQDMIDVSEGAKHSVVLFHYTDKVGFANITTVDKKSVEIFAALVTAGSAANAWYGQGSYATIKGPDDFYKEFHSHGFKDVKAAIVDNNYRRMAQRDGFEKYFPKVSFCVPILVALDNAYDVNKRLTPEMEAAGHGPGFNIKGDKLNEEGRPRRDQWVVRVDNEGVVENARANLLDLLRVRAKNASALQRPWTQNRLAFVLNKRGHVREGAEVAASAASFVEGMASHSNISLGLMHNKAAGLLHNGQPEVAIPIFEKVLEARTTSLGMDHPDTLRTLGTLANARAEIFDYEEAARLLRQRVECSERSPLLGPHHQNTLTAIHNLGVILIQKLDFQAAVPILRDCFHRSEKILGGSHPQTIQTMRVLTQAEHETNGSNGIDRLTVFQNNIKKSEKDMGPDAPLTLAHLQTLAEYHMETSNYGAAELIFERILQARERNLGPDAPETLFALNDLACTKSYLAKNQEAEVILREHKDRHLRTYGPQHPKTQRAVEMWEVGVQRAMFGFAPVVQTPTYHNNDDEYAKYKNELEQLRSMGFVDRVRNMQALRQARYDVALAVSFLASEL